MKMGAIGLMMITLLLALPLTYAQAAGTTCSDGTKGFACSSTQPGYACMPGSTSYTLQNMMGTNCPLAPSVCADYQAKCACSKYAGYVESNGQCVKSTCTDANGATVQNGLCASTPPKRCMNGQMTDDPSSCGCPSGQQASPDGKACVTSTGCRWHNPDCSANSQCVFVATNAADPGICKPKQGCAFGTVTCTDSQTCDTSSNANGVCKDKPGCVYLNPPCAKGQVCNAATNSCQAAPTGGSGSDTTLPSTGTSTPSSPSSPLSCCCLPAAGATGLVGLALLRRKDENEE